MKKLTTFKNLDSLPNLKGTHLRINTPLKSNFVKLEIMSGLQIGQTVKEFK